MKALCARHQAVSTWSAFCALLMALDLVVKAVS